MSEVNGSTFISINTKTEPKLNKFYKDDSGERQSNPHHGRIRKIMNGAHVMVFQNKMVNGYEAMVNRRLVQEGKDPSSFKLGERTWGSRIPNLPIVQHNDKLYLEVIFLKNGTSFHTLDGDVIDSVDIIGLPKTQHGEQGGLKNKVVIRTFAVNSLTSIRINQKIYTNIVN